MRYENLIGMSEKMEQSACKISYYCFVVMFGLSLIVGATAKLDKMQQELNEDLIVLQRQARDSMQTFPELLKRELESAASVANESRAQLSDRRLNLNEAIQNLGALHEGFYREVQQLQQQIIKQELQQANVTASRSELVTLALAMNETAAEMHTQLEEVNRDYQSVSLELQLLSEKSQFDYQEMKTQFEEQKLRTEKISDELQGTIAVLTRYTSYLVQQASGFYSISSVVIFEKKS